MTLFDAHCHLHNPRFGTRLTDCLSVCRKQGIQGWMVNATRESDWTIVSDLAASDTGISASYGLHPWWQNERSSQWASKLEHLLRSQPRSAIGETGLDQWKPGLHLPDQMDVLETHLELARQLERPISLHCLKAWPALKDVLQRFGSLPAGFLLHSYAAPPDMNPFWVQQGAYFSFSPYFLHPKKTAQRTSFRSLPLDRILIETDSPDMAPPSELAIESLPSLENTRLQPLNHPVNLRLCLTALATDRGLPELELAEILLANTRRFFGSTCHLS